MTDKREQDDMMEFKIRRVEPSTHGVGGNHRLPQKKPWGSRGEGGNIGKSELKKFSPLASNVDMKGDTIVEKSSIEGGGLEEPTTEL